MKRYVIVLVLVHVIKVFLRTIFHDLVLDLVLFLTLNPETTMHLKFKK